MDKQEIKLNYTIDGSISEIEIEDYYNDSMVYYTLSGMKYNSSHKPTKQPKTQQLVMKPVNQQLPLAIPTYISKVSPPPKMHERNYPPLLHRTLTMLNSKGYKNEHKSVTETGIVTQKWTYILKKL
ncbi:uncharacterized protein LOC144432396 [Styela clava]